MSDRATETPRSSTSESHGSDSSSRSERGSLNGGGTSAGRDGARSEGSEGRTGDRTGQTTDRPGASKEGKQDVADASSRQERSNLKQGADGPSPFSQVGNNKDLRWGPLDPPSYGGMHSPWVEGPPGKEGAQKPEAPKPDAPKPEAPKPEAPKPDAPKPEAPKPEAPKAEAPKPEAPKPAEHIGVDDIVRTLTIVGLGNLEHAIRTIVPEKFFEVGWARKGFVAGVTGAPIEPPTDPQDKQEWERGERMAQLVVAIDAIVGGMPPPGGTGGPRPGLAPAGGRHVPVEAAPPRSIPAPHLTPPPLEARSQPETPKTSTPAPAAGASRPPPPPPPETERRANIAKNPSGATSPSGQRGETPRQAQERTDAARREFEQRGGTVDKIVGLTQKHHIASNKDHSSPTAARNVEILEGARTPDHPGDVLDSDANKVRVEDHGDAHGENYHKVINNRLERAVKDLKPHTEPYRDAVLKELSNLKRDILTKGSDLNLMTIKVNRGGMR